MHYTIKNGKRAYCPLLGSLGNNKKDKSVFWGNLLDLGFKGDKEAAWKDYLYKSKKKK